MTRFSHLHPYPAMMADSLAEELSDEFVSRRSVVLDPFCGTGRTLIAAAQRGASAMGLDVNPLAVLIANAKAAPARAAPLERLLIRANAVGTRRLLARPLDLQPDRSVTWFHRDTETELRVLVDRIAESGLASAEMLVAAAVLSATVREVSYCRKDQWKLHRVTKSRRVYRSVFDVFARRLSTALRELREGPALNGECRVLRGDVTTLAAQMRDADGRRPNLVITSPPYGDSRTTLQYGGVSNLCLGVLRHLPGYEDQYTTQGAIDRSCLGGTPTSTADPVRKTIWHGRTDSEQGRRVTAFANAMAVALQRITTACTSDATMVFVVGRRTVGRYQVYLDRLLVEELGKRAFRLEQRRTRRIMHKLTPALIQRHARAGVDSTISTMRREHVLVFRRRQ